MEVDHTERISAPASVPSATDSHEEHSSDKKRERERSSTPLVDDGDNELESVGGVRNKRIKVTREIISHCVKLCFWLCVE